MPILPFPEMVEIEKGWGPLPEPVRSSNKIRRDLFHGKTVGTGETTSEKYGGTPALVNQICADMERWGFEFEKIKDADGGRQGYKLKNPTHIPIVKQKQERPHRDPSVPYQGQRTGVREKIREALLAGELMNSKQAMEKFGGSEGNLRAVVSGLRAKGYDVEQLDHPDGIIYGVKKASRDKKKTGTAVVPAKNPRLPVISMTPNGNGAHNMLDLPPIPAFGSSVQVVGTFLGRDGAVTLALRDDDNDWLTSIEGHSGGDND